MPRGTVSPCQNAALNSPTRHKWHGCATWHGHATWHDQAVPLGCLAKCAGLVGVGRATWVRFRGTFVRRFSTTFLAFLALLSAKCCSSFRFFNKVPENIERCSISKKYAKGDRFDHSLTQLNVKTGEKMDEIGAKSGTK